MMKIIISFERLYDVADPDEAMDLFSKGLTTGDWTHPDGPAHTTMYTAVGNATTVAEFYKGLE